MSCTPSYLAEKIVASRSALEGERKQVTVLFADLKGSMELLADRDPEEARAVLDPVLERMMEAVHRYEGTVNQVMGDGIMALFGAPVARRAIPLLEHTLRRCQGEDMALNTRLLTATLGYAYTFVGQTTDAIVLLERGIQQSEALKISFRYALWLAWLGEAYLLAGRTDEALDLAQRAVEHTRIHKEPGHQAYGFRLLGEIAMQRDPPEIESAEAHYRQAITLAEELGMRPIQAHCRLGLGTLYARTGRQEQARAEISAAIDLYRAMDMTFWLPQAEAALAQVEGR